MAPAPGTEVPILSMTACRKGDRTLLYRLRLPNLRLRPAIAKENRRPEKGAASRVTVWCAAPFCDGVGRVFAAVSEPLRRERDRSRYFGTAHYRRDGEYLNHGSRHSITSFCC